MAVSFAQKNTSSANKKAIGFPSYLTFAKILGVLGEDAMGMLGDIEYDNGK